MVYVLDASVALKWFLPEDDSDRARTLLARFLAEQDHLIAPDLIVSEFGHGLRKNFLGNRLTADDARAALADFLAVRFECVPASRAPHHAPV